MVTEEDEDQFILSKDYFTNENLYLGYIGEKVTTQAIKTKYKTSDGFKVKHNTFGKQYQYCCGSGVDIRIFEGNKELAQIEVKNLKSQNRPYGTDFVERHVIPRFNRESGALKLLVLTFLVNLTKKSLNLLHKAGIQLISVEKRLTTDFFTDNSVKRELYSLGHKIQQAITTFWRNKQIRLEPKLKRPFFVLSSNQLSLDTVISTIEPQQHDTLSPDWLQSNEAPKSPAHRLIWLAYWQAQHEQSIKQHSNT